MPALSLVPGWAGGEALLLTELPAILTDLARLRPALDLLPADPAREARSIEWMNWLSGQLHAVAFAQHWRPERFSRDPATFDAIRSRGFDNALDAFASIERTFSDGRAWAVPPAFTAVDAFLVVFYRWGRAIGVDMDGYRAWTASCRECVARPAVVAAFEKDGLDELWPHRIA